MKCSLDFGCICVWVKVSWVSQYPMEIKVRVPGQTPGLVHNLGGPLVLTDRQDRRHSIWIYYVWTTTQTDLDTGPTIWYQRRAKKYGILCQGTLKRVWLPTTPLGPNVLDTSKIWHPAVTMPDFSPSCFYMVSPLKARKERHWPGNHPLLLVRLPYSTRQGDGITASGWGYYRFITIYYGLEKD